MQETYLGKRSPAWWIQLSIYVFLIILAILFVFPFMWIVQTSLKSADEIYATPPTWMPQELTTNNYERLIDSDAFISAMKNSLVAAGGTTILCVSFSSLAGFGFAKYKFFGREVLFIIVLGSMMIPIVVTLVPNFLLMADLGLLNSLWAIILPSAITPFAVFWMRQYISTAIPDVLMEAARLDGASELRIFLSVVRPIITPGLVSLSIWVFILSWNDFIRPLVYLLEPSKFTLPVYLSTLRFSSSQFRIALDLIAAASTLSTLPVVCFFLVSQRAFVSGATAGAIRE